jgi:hypothetical protein
MGMGIGMGKGKGKKRRRRKRHTAHTKCLFYRDVVLAGSVHDYLREVR